MSLHLKKVFAILVVVQLFMVMVLLSFQNVAVSEDLPVIQVVDANNPGSSTTTFGDTSTDMPLGGYNFTVNVVLSGSVSGLYTYQIALGFNLTNTRCTAAWVPKQDPSFIFYGKTSVEPPSPIIDNEEYGYAVTGSTLMTGSADVSQGLFAKFNFTVFKTGSFSINVIKSDPYYPDNSFLTDQRQIDIAFNTQSLTVSVAAKPSPPVPSFVFSPENPDANETVVFDASGSFDPDGFIVSYYWDFGDGYNTTTVAFNLTHAFAQRGVFYVNLTVTDDEGFNASIVQEVPVGPIPVPVFTYDWERKDEFPLYPYMDIAVTFNATLSFDPSSRTPELSSGNITLYVWNFTRLEFHTEDIVVSYLPANVSSETSTNATLTYSFTRNSIYNVKLTVFNNEGLSNSTSQNIFVGKPPVANFRIDTSPPFMPDDPIIFNGYGSQGELSYGVDGPLVFALWDFGDINVTAINLTVPSDNILTHTYVGQGGLYTVNMTVFDFDGLYTSAQNDINVTIIATKEKAGSGWEGYAAAGAIFGLIVAAAVWYRRRPEKEPNPKDRYRVI